MVPDHCSRTRVVTLPPGEKEGIKEVKESPLDSFLTHVIRSMTRAEQGVKVDSVETGQVEGVTFARAKVAEASKPGEALNFLSVNYLRTDDVTFVLLRIIDLRAHFDESAKLGTAAILTFRRK